MAPLRSDYSLSQLDSLEAESVHIIREVAAEFERPVLLFSGGKDSIVMLALAERAFWPARIPFPVMHVDTGHNFDEVIEFRDRRVAEAGVQLIVASVQDSIDAGRVVEETGDGPAATGCRPPRCSTGSRSTSSTPCSAAPAGMRKRPAPRKRVFSFRDEFGKRDPKNQRPELWGVYNTRIDRGEHIRVFPLSNWTELDVWEYIDRENLEIPSIYYAHTRSVFERDGILLADSEYTRRADDEQPYEAKVRYRTVGHMAPAPGPWNPRPPRSAEATIVEIAATRDHPERGQTRADDRTSEAAMEDRKREGYF